MKLDLWYCEEVLEDAVVVGEEEGESQAGTVEDPDVAKMLRADFGWGRIFVRSMAGARQAWMPRYTR